MTRKDFLTNTCGACIAVTGISALLPACSATRYIPGTLVKDGVIVSRNDFAIVKKGAPAHRPYIIVKNDTLQYPICVYRVSDNEYSAVWMRCTHQGAELQVSGDSLQCPAHGSVFTSKGAVSVGPAGDNLRSFPVRVADNEIFIDLRKQS